MSNTHTQHSIPTKLTMNTKVRPTYTTSDLLPASTEQGNHDPRITFSHSKSCIKTNVSPNYSHLNSPPKQHAESKRQVQRLHEQTSTRRIKSLPVIRKRKQNSTTIDQSKCVSRRSSTRNASGGTPSSASWKNSPWGRTYTAKSRWTGPKLKREVK